MADLIVVLVFAVRFYCQVLNVFFLGFFLDRAVSDDIGSVLLAVERKRAAGLAVMLAAPYVDDLSIFVRVAIDRPNAVARLLVLFEIEQGADGIPICIFCIGRYVLKDELAGRAVIKQVADVADDVAVFVDARGAKIARGARWRAQTWCKSVPRSVAASPDVTPS